MYVDSLDIGNIIEFIEQSKVIKTGLIGIDFNETYWNQVKNEVEILTKCFNETPKTNWKILAQHKEWKNRFFRGYVSGFFTDTSKSKMPKAWTLSHEPKLYCGIEKFLVLYDTCYAKKN